MARRNWEELQARFLIAHAETGVSPKEWCESEGLKYSTAKEYIKKSPRKPKPPSKQKPNSGSEKPNSVFSESASDLLENEELNWQQARFIVEYIKDLNGTQAAIRAGYSESSASQIAFQLLQKTSVSREVKRQLEAACARHLVTSDIVIGGIIQNIRRCEQASPVFDMQGNQVFTETPEGETAAAYEYDAKNVLKGYEMLGKYLKLFTDKVDHTSSDGTMATARDKDKRRARIKELMKKNAR